MVVVYKTHPLTAVLARRLLQVPWIGLVNIVAGKQLVPELWQEQVQPQAIAAYALRCLEHPEEMQRIRHTLGVVRSALGEGDSARRAARTCQPFSVPDWHVSTRRWPLTQREQRVSGTKDAADYAWVGTTMYLGYTILLLWSASVCCHGSSGAACAAASLRDVAARFSTAAIARTDVPWGR